MKLTAQTLRRSLVWSSVMLVGTGAIAVMPFDRLSNSESRVAIAQANHPFQGHSIVYVQTGDRWREAFIKGVVGQFSRGRTVWAYTVDFLDAAGGSEEGIPPDRLVTVAEAQAQGLTQNVYNVSTPAGVNQMLEAHNVPRRAVGVPDLQWSPELSEFAQTWANQLVTEGRLRHRPAAERAGGSIGENLSSNRSSGPGGALSHPQRAVSGWVSEKTDYDYTNNSCASGKMCGHYTQMVWQDTEAVGCAVARNADNSYEVWVCNYSPAGNFEGERPY